MTEREMIEYFNSLCAEHEVSKPRKIGINGRLSRSLARVMCEKSFYSGFKPVGVEFSKALLSSEEALVRDIIKHEFAHYYLASHGIDDGHGSVFKKMCAKLDCKNDGATVKTSGDVESRPSQKYEVFCTECGSRVAGYGRWCKTLDHLKEGRAKSGCCKSKCDIKVNW